MSAQEVLEQERNSIQVNSILISQPQPPANAKSPYDRLVERYGIKVDFRQFIQVDQVPFKEFRKEKIDILSYSAIILTSRNAVDNLFRVCKEARIEMPADMKYFCISDQTAYYLQKYIVIRKRKLFVGTKTANDLLEVLKKHQTERFLFPCSDIRKDDIPAFLEENDFVFKEAVLYKTVASDLSDLAEVNYDMIAFFSPSGVSSLFTNFPDFKQNKTRIAAFGPTTAKAVREHGLILDVEAPHPDAPSMTGAIELYIKESNK